MNKENWNKFLSEIIKSSINRDEMIGDNLRTQCVEYFEQLETSITSKDNGLLQLKEELLQLKTNRDELKKWLEEEIKQYDNVGLKFKKQGNFECASRSYKYSEQYQTMLSKMQELERGKE